jgi:hypothetical protein
MTAGLDFVVNLCSYTNTLATILSAIILSQFPIAARPQFCFFLFFLIRFIYGIGGCRFRSLVRAKSQLPPSAGLVVSELPNHSEGN